VEGEYFVPDSMSHTLTFFAAVFAAMLAARAALKPDGARQVQ